LVLALAEYDRATAAHSRRVRRYALWAAEELGLEHEQCQERGLAALAHDGGKMCLPRSLLNKAGRLTCEEGRLVRGHPVAGELLLSALVPRTELTDAVRSHHEHYDGNGYPDGLEGACIPLLARVLTVADAFDAMTSARPYSRPVAWAQALDRLRGSAGTQFDPAVVEGFARALRRACGGPRGVRWAV
jgi:HD-GYP domain-containing protein (c-di-GMP phosphodiesterase class II)